MTAPAPGGDWFSDLFGFAETNYEEARRWLRVLPNDSREGLCAIESRANGARFNAGSFETPSLAELRTRGQEALKKMQPATLKVSNELGDVAKKHTQAENRFATFQVASQFNCLEFVGPQVVPEDGVTQYIHDRTQGPACSIACGPATVYRNYFAPVQSGFPGQTRHCQIDNLSEVSRVVGNLPRGKFFDVKGGYTLSDASRLRKLDGALMKLTEEGKLDDVRAALRIGVHSDAQVTSCSWGSCRVQDPEQAVTQVFGSACAVAYNHSTDSRSWRSFASIILEASYEATLWAALLNAQRHGGRQGSRRVFLTCLGGGVFGNSMSWITQAMRRAFENFKDCDLDVRVVTYAGTVDPQLQAIEEEFAARHALALEKKRARVEETREDPPKRQKSESSTRVIPLQSAPSLILGNTAGESTPGARKKEEEGLPSSPPKAGACDATTKRSKGRTGKADKEPPQPKLDATVVRDAERLGYAGALRNLASRPEVAALGVSSRVMLEALKDTDGLVNPAKRAITGA